MTRTDDERLRALFARAHQDDRPPPFRALVERAGGRSGVGRRWLWVGAAAALVMALLWGLPGGGPDPAPPGPELALGSTGWEGELDFLLETPGSEILETVPTFALGSAEEGWPTTEL